MDGLDTIENLYGNHLEVGSRWRLVFGEDELIETVTAVEPPKRYAFDCRAPVSPAGSCRFSKGRSDSELNRWNEGPRGPSSP